MELGTEQAKKRVTSRFLHRQDNETPPLNDRPESAAVWKWKAVTFDSEGERRDTEQTKARFLDHFYILRSPVASNVGRCSHTHVF